MAKVQVDEEKTGTFARAGGVFYRIFGPLAQYFRETRAELRKVTWPTPVEARNLTALVLSVMVFLALVLGGLDALYGRLLDALFQMVGRGV